MAKVLLIECDPLQAILRKSVLEKEFARVERVANPAEALCLVEQPQQDFDLVVCGSQRAGFGGAAFVQELRDRRPRLPVLVLGGVDEHASDYAGSAVRFLAAPVESDELIFFASQLLGHAGGDRIEPSFPRRARG